MIADITLALKRLPLVYALGWQDLRQRYRRTTLGPFWLTLSMGVMIATIGVVFGQIFNQSTLDYLPFLSVGIISWAFLTSVMREGCTAFIDAEGIIKQLPIPLLVHVMRVMWRNLLILGHNILILPFVLLIVQKDMSAVALLALPGLLLTCISLGWIALLLAMVCARYRDMPQMVGSVLDVAFYLTPVIWMPSLLGPKHSTLLIDFNPFYHFLELIRSPLLGVAPQMQSWIVVSFIALLGWICTLIIFARLRQRIAYWL